MASAFQTSQVAVLTTATQLVPARGERSRVILKNTGAATVFIGRATVTLTTGHALAAGETLDLSTEGAIYAIAAATGSTVTCYQETR